MFYKRRAFGRSCCKERKCLVFIYISQSRNINLDESIVMKNHKFETSKDFKIDYKSWRWHRETSSAIEIETSRFIVDLKRIRTKNCMVIENVQDLYPSHHFAHSFFKNCIFSTNPVSLELQSCCFYWHLQHSCVWCWLPCCSCLDC